MADVKISNLPTASTLSDTDFVVVNQGSPAQTKKATVLTLLPNVNTSTAGTYGTDSQVPQITVDIKGRITSVVNTPISASNISAGTLPVNRGGTGASTQQGALNAIAASTTSGQYLRGNGTNVVMSAIQAGDITAAAMPAFTGDVTTTAGSTVTTLASSGVSPFTYGTSSKVGTFTVNAKGIITSAIQTDIDPVAIGAISTTQGGTISSTAITGTALNISCANSQYAIRTTTQIASPTFFASSDLSTGTSITTNGVSLKAGAGVTFGSLGIQTTPFRTATGTSSTLSLSLANNTQQVVTVSVANAGFGVPAFASLSASPSPGLALIISAYCSSAGTVTVVIRNESGATISFSGVVFATVLY